jgi:dUTP pyrophosphatase
MTKLIIERLDEDLPLPKYESKGAAGIDLYLSEDIGYTDWFQPNRNGSALVGTGIRVGIPEGFVGLIRSRSSLASKFGIDVAAGVIDSDYRGEVKVLLRDSNMQSPSLLKGIRIAQLLIVPCGQMEIVEGKLRTEETARGDGGFGSTGI